jgi:hypothetical protein
LLKDKDERRLKKRMNKILTTLVIASVLVMSSGFVLAADQGINVTIGQNITLLITPTEVDFGTVAPGTTDNAATNGPIGFDGSGSNSNMTIEVTNVTGFPFDTGLKLDGATPIGQIFNQNCLIVSNLCTYTPATTVPTLDVLIGTPQGVNNGVITYLITGSPP